MKHLALYLRYISLLIFSGLISPFYNSTAPGLNRAEKNALIKTTPAFRHDILAVAPFSFFNDVVVPFFPALKN